MAAEVGATPVQITLSWLLADGDDIATILDRRWVAWVEENTATNDIMLTPTRSRG